MGRMISGVARRGRLLLAVVVALVMALGVVVGLPASTAIAAAAEPALTTVAGQPRTMPEPPPVRQVRKELAALPVAEPHLMNGYSRDKFPHWAAQGGACDTREVVLKRDGENVEQDARCRAVAGSWYSPYDATVVPKASGVDIDHMVPLANAWRSGADLWDTPRRKAFANDLTNSQLIAVSARSNRAKSDKSPDQWQPPNRVYWCTYSRAWTHVKSLYGLNVTVTEKTTLRQMLNTCTRVQNQAA